MIVFDLLPDRGTQFAAGVRAYPESAGQAVAAPPPEHSVDVRYALQVAGGTLGPWTTVTLTSPRKLTISGLTLAGIYQFQIRALGKLGYTDWMDTKTFVVA